MNASTWSWRLVCAAGMVLALCLARPSWADDKAKKGSAGGKSDGKVIIIQLDASKASPALLNQLAELSRGSGTAEKKTGKKDDDDDDKKKETKKGGDDKKKADDKKSNVVQVDLNKLPPDLAKRLAAELAKSKGAPQKGSKKNDDDDGKKKSTKKDDDDDDKKKGAKKDDDDKKGKKKDDDDKKKSKKKDD